jgi:hypothetical protein
MYDNLSSVKTILNMISLVCLIYLAFNSIPLFFATVTLHFAIAAFLMWRGVRDEIQNGNKQ